jgi:Family of unknown function (DUF5681)
MAREVRQRRRPAPPPTAIAAGGKPDAAKNAGDYEVGYKKPPKDTQFQPGQSGNPNGRPKGTKNLKTDLAEELQERIALREGGERHTVSKQRAMLKRLMERALHGDTKAASLIINMVARFLDQTEDEEHATPLTETDRAILDAYVARMTANRKSRSTT